MFCYVFHVSRMQKQIFHKKLRRFHPWEGPKLSTGRQPARFCENKSGGRSWLKIWRASGWFCIGFYMFYTGVYRFHIGVYIGFYRCYIGLYRCCIGSYRFYTGFYKCYISFVGGGFRDVFKTGLTSLFWQESVYFPVGFSVENRYKSILIPIRAL